MSLSLIASGAQTDFVTNRYLGLQVIDFLLEGLVDVHLPQSRLGRV